MAVPIIADETLSSAAQTIDIEIPDLDLVEVYLSAYFNSQNSDYYVYINQDYTNAHYYRQRYYANNGAAAAADTNNSPHMFAADLGFLAKITIACNGQKYPSIIAEGSSIYDTDEIAVWAAGIIYTDSNLSSIDEVRLHAGVANAFGIGTRYIVRDLTL